MDPSRDSHPSTPTTAADAPAGAPSDGAVEPLGHRAGEGPDSLLHYCHLAAGRIGLFADGIEAIAAGMREGDAAHLSAQVAGMADGLRRLSGKLRSQDPGQILRDAQRLAREHPTLLIAGGIAAGLGLARASVTDVAALGERLRAATANPTGRDGRADAATADAPPATRMPPGTGEPRDRERPGARPCAPPGPEGTPLPHA